MGKKNWAKINAIRRNKQTRKVAVVGLEPIGDVIIPNQSGVHEAGRVEVVRLRGNALVNKEYIDNLTTNHPHQDVTLSNTGLTIASIPYTSDDATNVFIGFEAGLNNAVSGTQGKHNYFLGQQAGKENTSGEGNTAIGSTALANNTTGGSNTVIGKFAGQGSAVGAVASACVFIGTNAGNSSDGASGNVCIGYQAGRHNESGDQNTFVGREAGFGVAGQNHNNNTGLGQRAGFVLTTGSNNVLVGFGAGNALTTGSNNIIIGYDLDASAVGVSDELNIGNVITGDMTAGAGSLSISAKLGIGATPTAALQLGSNTGVNGGDFYSFNNGGSPRFLFGDNISAGNYGGLQWQSGTDSIRLFTEAFGITQMVLKEDGNVGIDTATPTQPLSVKEKGCMTAIGGFAVKLTNKTGGDTVAGQLVEIYSATAIDDAFKTAVGGSDECIGVTLDAGVADGSEAWVVMSGIADVLMDSGGSARSSRAITSATAGSADMWDVGGAVATHFQEIGHCLENRTGAGLARCVLHFN
jgi:hypothetical protein